MGKSPGRYCLGHPEVPPGCHYEPLSAQQAGGHGHHMATALLIKEAFAAAGDPGRFPEQLKFAAAWKPRRLLWNIWRPSPEAAKSLLRVDTGEYNPLLGKSYSEIAALSRSQHKSQGFGSAGRRGTQPDHFEVGAGDPAADDIFEGIDVSWSRVPAGKKPGSCWKRSWRLMIRVGLRILWTACSKSMRNSRKSLTMIGSGSREESCSASSRPAPDSGWRR